MGDHEVETAAYSKRVGERLRAIRKQKRLSLQQVEADSNHEFRASVVGAYERGERAVSVPRLQRLAAFFGVPVDQLLPNDGPDFGVSPTIDLTEGARSRTNGDYSLTLDLRGLNGLVGPEAEMLRRFVTMIQIQRQDFNGKVLTIRRDDVRALAAILGVSGDAVHRRVRDLGLAYAST